MMNKQKLPFAGADTMKVTPEMSMTAEPRLFFYSTAVSRVKPLSVNSFSLPIYCSRFEAYHTNTVLCFK